MSLNNGFCGLFRDIPAQKLIANDRSEKRFFRRPFAFLRARRSGAGVDGIAVCRADADGA